MFLIYLSLLSIASELPYCDTVHTPNKICEKCTSNYLLINAKCHFAYENGCASVLTNKCSACMRGYKMDVENGVCVVGDEYCNKGTSRELACQTCRADLTSIDQKYCLNCTTSNPGCVTADGKCDNCNKCKDGYYLSGKTCVRIPNCKLSGNEQAQEDKTVCKECIDGYYLDSTKKCVKGAIAHCLSYSSASICQKCETSYLTVNNKCTLMEGCSALTLEKDKCNSCTLGYGLDSGMCKKCSIDHCKVCGTNYKECTMCLDEYSKEDDKCVPCTSPNCKVCNSIDKTKCTYCLERLHFK
ncbi:hypothetical protein EIN_517260 [Entamoeba invadens IP1]|uniref:Furin repeat-containing protein n=1 Tax=Entamoeba invadens IP1 TaxID=370355 RepID=L7FKL9_ENTIV|nr:hypothetical protein EIN_517260 [Entamoeba invadens IP1]ELP86810.1 hypothetical protein EIN_517260 [Entamoeba invadens IP1]|eukprot:XP_004253581.1 hypothetical protein EIN_517260 [Entamoeba invadens IP1]